MAAKKWILFSIGILAILIGYNVFSGEMKKRDSRQAIVKVAKDYLKSFAAENIESAMNQISEKYRGVDANGRAIDHDKFKVQLKEYMNNIAKRYTDYFYNIDALEINKLDIRNKKATLEFKIIWKALNLETKANENGKLERIYYFVKENGLWKISRIQR